MKPFLKWPGGKRWSADLISGMVRSHLEGTYYEPFLGGAAVFFELLPAKAVLADVNPELIETYKQVRSGQVRIRTLLQTFPVTKEFYDAIRSEVSPDELMQAARFLYLNRTSFAGIYRLNKNGKFNVPFGGGERTPAFLLQSGILQEAAKALKGATLKCADFEKVMKRAKRGDVIYCDPTYTVAHDNNGFRRYNESVFSWSDQERLALATFDAQERGATVFVSNAHHKSVYELFAERSKCKTHTLNRTSCMATKASHRKTVQEYLFEFSG